ncbi:hypothetical protein BOX15_Mlig005754g2 [Macrostomum lignano]|uniref:Uncharacterized protein n=1 Tax=Macrostomum lignano TaxID=282301 RepID=A0A267H316_9PLAT|nr:hypothetical protein BOX15_Mlig005754g2 [Macrostomum lignano]
MQQNSLIIMSNPIKLRYNRIVWGLLFLVLLIGILFIYVDYTGLINENVPQRSNEISKKPSLTYKSRQFYLNGQPLQIISGTINYFRVHRKYWRTRLLQLKAAGFNTVDTCIPWNLHEKTKGSFNFHADFNIRKFIKLAQSVGLYVIIKPGPFVGSQIDFGGLPGWLLKDANMRVRSMYMGFTLAVDNYFQVLMHQLVDLQASPNGGPIIAIQLEHEYGSFGDSLQYLHFLRSTLRRYGATEAFYACETVEGFSRHRRLNGDFIGINFNRPEDGRRMISNRQAWGRDLPLFVSELWSGHQLNWNALDRHDVIRPATLANLISKLLGPMRASLSLHMFHGGTNFGFMASRLVATSHDWDAPVHESGSRDTLKYRAVAAAVSMATGNRSDSSGRRRAEKELFGIVGGSGGRVKDYGNFSIDSVLTWSELINLIEDPKLYESAKFMEEVDQNFGFIVYRSAFKAGQVVTVDGYVADWGLLLINGAPPDPADPSSGQLSGAIPRQHDQQQQVQQQQPAQRHLSLKRSQLAAPTNTLDLIVENLGRSSSSSGGAPEANAQRKGLASWQSLNAEQLQAPGRLLINEQPVPSYKIYSLRLDAAFMAKVAVRRSSWLSVSSAAALPRGQPGLYRASLRLMDEPLADTYLDMSAWRKGVAFVNGFNLGRYWTEAGPQRTLYLPAPLLRRGDNEVIIFELIRPGSHVSFMRSPKFVYPV